ncbi:MAG: DEAD/DEAH box helicase [Malacoplasma sp.]
MKKLNFNSFTEIQQKTIPLIANNENVIGVANTGTGKTHCFLFPLIDNLDLSLNKIQILIISPTRELSRQIYDKAIFFKKFAPELSVSLLIGGKEYTDATLSQILKKQILITTPQKFFDFLQSFPSSHLSKLKTIVLDEADMLMDMNFSNSIINVFNSLTNLKNIQKIAFSATLHETLSIQLSKFFHNSTIVNVSKNIWLNDKITHHIVYINNLSKEKALIALLEKINPYFCIIFSNTKKDVEMIFNILYKKYKSDVIMLHGDMNARERKNTFKIIQTKNARFLVATDLASRGIDIDGASDIISWDMPKDDVWYIHRSGRSGRSHYKGNSYIFFENNTHQILRLQNKNIVWNSLKFNGQDFVPFNISFKMKKKKITEVDKQISSIISKAPKKVKPNYKKKIKIQIDDVKRKAKRNRIEELVNKERIKNYKIENAKKTKEKSSI